MTWHRVAGEEPSRSRVLIVAGGVISTAFVTAVSWASGTRSLWWFPALMGTWLVLFLAIAVVVVGVTVRAGVHVYARPMRFVRWSDSFGVTPVLSPGLTAMLQIMLSGLMLATLLGAWRRPERSDPALSKPNIVFNSVMTTMVVVIMLLTAAIVFFSWRGFAVDLTRAGVRWRSPLFDRLVPWEALEPGGPPRPQLNAHTAPLDRCPTRTSRPAWVGPGVWSSATPGSAAAGRRASVVSRGRDSLVRGASQRP